MRNVRWVSRCGETIRLFHEEEDGSSSLEVISVIVIAVAVIYFFAKYIWPMILDYSRTSVKDVNSYRPIE